MQTGDIRKRLSSMEPEKLARLRERLRSSQRSDRLEGKPYLGWLRCFRRREGPALIMVPPLPGHTEAYDKLVDQLTWNGPVYAIQARGLRRGDLEPVDSVKAMAQNYVTLLRNYGVGLDGVLVGYSMGGLVALEMVRQLRASDLKIPGSVVMLDTNHPLDMYRFLGVSDFVWQMWGQFLGFELSEVEGLSRDEVCELLRVKARSVGYELPGFVTPLWLRAFEVHQIAQFSCQPQSIMANVVYVSHGSSRPPFCATPQLRWHDLIQGKLVEVRASGDHFTMMTFSLLTEWVKELDCKMAEMMDL